MKLFNNIWIKAGMLFLCTACGEDFLEKNPIDQVVETNFYRTENDALAAINAAYAPLQNAQMYNRAWRWGAKTDELNRTFDWYLYDYSPTSSVGSNVFWGDLYQGNFAANVVLEKVPGMSISEDLKSRILGEAYFLRGFYYYKLLRWFGGVPIILQVPTASTSFVIPRNTEEEVYAQVINDFSEAINRLPLKSAYASVDLGRATKGAAQTMLADMYIYRAAPGDYEKARDLLQEVVNSNQYSLEATFEDVFKLANENGKESIFEVQFQSGNQGEGTIANQFVTDFLSSSVQPSFYNGWDATDIRKKVSTIAPGESKGGWTNADPAVIQSAKQVIGRTGTPDAGVGGDSPKNFIVQRYANVLLLLAEMLNELNATPPAEAIGYVNQIRKRAGLSELPADITKTDLRQAIRNERKYELAFEAHRWFDLVRYERMGLGGGVVDVLGNPNSPHYNANFRWPKHALQPIPQNEIDNNPVLVQNPEY